MWNTSVKLLQYRYYKLTTVYRFESWEVECSNGDINTGRERAFISNSLPYSGKLTDYVIWKETLFRVL